MFTTGGRSEDTNEEDSSVSTTGTADVLRRRVGRHMASDPMPAHGELLSWAVTWTKWNHPKSHFLLAAEKR
jgi:hypothetical protein